MEVLNEQDLDWLTGAENRLIRMRKRESACTKSKLIIDELTDSIEHLHILRQWLQGRFEQEVDKDLHPFEWRI